METFKQKLENWAKETADFYHNLATSDENFDIAFYTQSNLTNVKHSPSLLILAINPGSAGSYTEQMARGGRMTGETLLVGNRYWEDRNEWGFWKNLTNIFRRGNIESLIKDDTDFAFTNLTFFATKKAHELPSFEKGVDKIIKLINILQPKNILCLGGAGCIEPLRKVGKFDVKELLPFSLLNYGNFGGIRIYSIRHTASRPAYTVEEMNLIGKCLRYLIENPKKEFSAEEIQEKFADDIKAVEDRKNNKANKQ